MDKKARYLVPFNDLGRENSEARRSVAERISLVVASGNYILGPETQSFETELASYLGTDFAVGVGSGSDALTLAFIALGVVRGDAVITMANAGGYSSLALDLLGAHPVFADVAVDSLQLTPDTLEDTLRVCELEGIKPKGVAVTHLFGQINKDIDQILQIAKRQELFVLEDCAQSLGASLSGRQSGTFGDLSTFSFYPTKNLGAFGDGGAISGSDTRALEKAAKLRNYGWGTKYHIEIKGGKNSRLDEIQAAVLLDKLPRLNSLNGIRRAIYQRYKESAGSGVCFYSSPDESYVAHLAPVTVSGMSGIDVKQHFESFGIETSVHFPVPDHEQQIEFKFKDLVQLPVSEYSCANLVTIPLFPEMTEAEVSLVCSALAGLDIQ